ncbi:MAG TPA: carboxymuconolactone decarboxylase family protein [Candidatus Binatia bacterium]|nr:carboxymuconolactone decarboxylase family protein [Candidatus Binatia bacterium]
MPARLNYAVASHGVLEAMMDLQKHVNNSGLEPGLLNLVDLLVSRINGCAYCIDMHSKDLRAAGESELRIDLVSVWEESDLYSERERAAFAWAESVTKVSETHVPDEVFTLARKHFSPEELVKLTLAVVAINGWNRFSVAFRAEPGHYRPAQHAVERSSAA